jgi:O-antigen biosynthesis protein
MTKKLTFSRRVRLKIKAVNMVIRLHGLRKKIKRGKDTKIRGNLLLLNQANKRSFFQRYHYSYSLLKDQRRISPKIFSHKQNSTLDREKSRHEWHHRENQKGRILFEEQQNEFSKEEIESRIKNFQLCPLISVIVPVYDTPTKWLELAIESLINQSYSNWELCVVDDFSQDGRPRALIKKYAEKDIRIKYHFSEKNQGISQASNIAIEISNGEFLALLDHDDELTPDALFWIVNEINLHPEVDLIYTDECKISDDDDRRLFSFNHKPKWSPEVLLNMMYILHLAVYRKTLITEIGGFRPEYDFSQDYDLALRFTEKTTKINHVERLLYLWRAIDGSAAKGGKGFARSSNLAALKDAMIRRGIDATVINLAYSNYAKINVRKKEKISIVIPTDSYVNATRSINLIVRTTSYPDYEIIIVCNSKLASSLEKEYHYDKNIIFSKFDKIFNFSEKCNQGTDDAKGEIVIFYNDDVYPMSKSWIEDLIEYLYLPGIGGVSPRLLFENNTIQYAGLISGSPGLVSPVFHGISPGNDYPSLEMHNWVRNVTALTGACLAIRKKLFFDLGKFDNVNTPDGHSDIDLSYKIIEAGFRCVYTPQTTLYHIGNHSWVYKNKKDKCDIFMLKKWNHLVSHDPYYTESMKRVLFNQFGYNYKIFSSTKNNKKTQFDALICCYELSISDNTDTIYRAVQAISNKGGFPVIICDQDGPMRQKFNSEGITVIVDESIGKNDFLFEKFAANFDLILVNTIFCFKIINQLEKYKIPTLWFINEGKREYDILDSSNKVELTRALKNTNNFYATFPEHSINLLKKHNPKIKGCSLHNGIPEIETIDGWIQAASNQ